MRKASEGDENPPDESDSDGSWPGSSSACIVGGIVGANHLLGSPLCQRELVNIAATNEGHPDNSTRRCWGTGSLA